MRQREGVRGNTSSCDEARKTEEKGRDEERRAWKVRRQGSSGIREGRN